MVHTINEDPGYASHLIADPGRDKFYEVPRESEGLRRHLRKIWS